MNQKIRDRLNREAENWIQRQEAESAIRRWQMERRRRNLQLAGLWGRSALGISILILAVLIIQRCAK